MTYQDNQHYDILPAINSYYYQLYIFLFFFMSAFSFLPTSHVITVPLTMPRYLLPFIIVPPLFILDKYIIRRYRAISNSDYSRITDSACHALNEQQNRRYAYLRYLIHPFQEIDCLIKRPWAVPAFLIIASLCSIIAFKYRIEYNMAYAWYAIVAIFTILLSLYIFLLFRRLVVPVAYYVVPEIAIIILPFILPHAILLVYSLHMAVISHGTIISIVYQPGKQAIVDKNSNKALESVSNGMERRGFSPSYKILSNRNGRAEIEITTIFKNKNADETEKLHREIAGRYVSAIRAINRETGLVNVTAGKANTNDRYGLTPIRSFMKYLIASSLVFAIVLIALKIQTGLALRFMTLAVRRESPA